MKILKRILIAVGALVLLLAGVVVTKFYLLAPRYRAAAEMHATSTPETIERGRYLVHHVAGCVGCHSESDVSAPGDPPIAGKELQGRHFDMPGFPGDVRGPNLTPDPETGLGQWTDGEIVRAMREGVSRDGRPLFGMMPFRALSETLTDEDALAIVAYLRSLPPVHSEVGHTTLRFPISMLSRTGPRPLEKPLAAVPTDPLEHGRWLMRIGNCASCHDSHDSMHEPIPGRRLAGGDPFPMPDGSHVYAANISSDPGTGIGAYSDEDLDRVLTTGVNKAGRPLYFMPFTLYRGLTPEDRKALILALRQEAAVMNVVPQRAASVAQTQ